MQRRIMLLLIALLLASLVALFAAPPAQAIQTWVEKGKSDCASLELAITLVYSQDDVTTDNGQPNDERRDYFKLEIFDAEFGGFVASASASLLQEQSPFYWQTHRIEGAPSPKGLYRIEVWDTDASGKHIRKIDEVYLQCLTGSTMWRDNPPNVPPNPNVPSVDCFVRMPIYTTNSAPEKGVVVVLWSYGTSRTDINYHLDTLPVERGDYFDNIEIEVPCETYVKIYYQPDSTKLLYYMPSQYYPHDYYGSPPNPGDLHGTIGPVYHTFFPLDGPPRSDQPAPTATPIPVGATPSS